MAVAVSGLLLTACQSLPDDPLGRANRRQPDPSLSAREVVEIQLHALLNNGPDDRGIEIAFRFASPANRAATGPAPRFAGMIRSPAYRIMLDYDSVEYAPLLVNGDAALQRVTLTKDGRSRVFDFHLRRQRVAPYEGCWMTEGVTQPPLRRGPQPPAVPMQVV